MDAMAKTELEKKRKQRLLQVRQQSKDIALELRNRVAAEKKRKSSELAKAKCRELKEWQDQQLRQLQNEYAQSLCEIGTGHKEAAEQPSPTKVLKEKRKLHNNIANKRGEEARRELRNKQKEKQLGQNVKKRSFRSVVIASPSKGKIKVAHTIKGRKSNAIENTDYLCDVIENDVIDDATTLANNTKAQKEVVTKRSLPCDEMPQSIMKTDSNILEGHSEDFRKIHMINESEFDDVATNNWSSNIGGSTDDKFHQERISSYVTGDNIYDGICSDVPSKDQLQKTSENIDSDNPWICKCCRMKRTVGTQCACACSKENISNTININKTPYTIDPSVAEHISALNKKTDTDSRIKKGGDIFTQVSDRIKTRKFTNVLRSPSKSVARKPTEKLYNPEQFVYDTGSSLDTGQHLSNLSPLTEVSEKIRSGVQNAKKHLENIEPDVAMLKKNIENLNREHTKESSQKSVISSKQSSPMKSSRAKSCKTPASTAMPGTSKIQMYDSETKFQKEYDAPLNLVKKLDSDVVSAHDLARKERSNQDKEKLIQSQKRKSDIAKLKYRGRKALQQKRTMQNLDNISESLATLTRQENAAKISQEHVLHTAEQLKELENQRQEAINKAFENVLKDDDIRVPAKIITLKKVTKSKGKGKENFRMTTTVTMPNAKLTNKHSRLNVANWNIPDNAHIFLKSQEQRADEKNSSSNSSEVIGQLEENDVQTNITEDQALKDLLNRVNRQREMLLEEVSKKDLPQNSKLTDVLDAVEQSLLKSEDTSQHSSDKSGKKSLNPKDDQDDEARKLKKQKRKLAKKEEELKLKELQLDLLIQKHKVNELEEKRKPKVDSCNKESSNLDTDEKVNHTNANKALIDSIKNIKTDIKSQDKPSETNVPKIPSLDLSSSTSSEHLSGGVEIVIKVKDKTKKKKMQSAPRKFSVRTKGPSVVKKHTRKVNSKFKSNMRECNTKPVKTKRVNETSETSSTSYMSPPKDFTKISKLVNFPKKIPQQSKTKFYDFQQRKRQTNVPALMDSNEYMYESTMETKPIMDKAYKKNPQLLKYINKLLSMSKGSIDALAVSSCSDVSTPNESVINIPSNQAEVIQDTVDRPSEQHIKKVRQFIERNYNFLEELQSSIKKESLVDNHSDKIPVKLPNHKMMPNVKHIKSSPHKSTQTKFNIDKGIQVPKIYSETKITSSDDERNKIVNKQIQVSDQNEMNLNYLGDSRDIGPRISSINSITTQTDEVQRLADNCNQRISNLADLIYKVRQEKLRLLESSLSSSSSIGQNSTEYLDLPSTIQDNTYKNHNLIDECTNEKDNRNITTVSSSIIEKQLFEESPPQFETTGPLELEQFVPMLKDIPKPSEHNINIQTQIMEQVEDSGQTNGSKQINADTIIENVNVQHINSGQMSERLECEITDLKHNMDGLNKQLNNIENCMGQIQEYIHVDFVAKHRQKPPASLLRHMTQIRNNVNVDAGTPHELSAIIEVDTSAPSNISEANIDISTVISDSFENPVVQETVENVEGAAEESATKDTAKKSEAKPIQYLEQNLEVLGNVEPYLKTALFRNIFDESNLSITLKSPSKNDDTKFNTLMESINKSNLKIKPFPTFEEYTDKLEDKIDDTINTTNFSSRHEIEKTSDKVSNKNDETLPDVLSELMRRNVLQVPFNNEIESVDTSATEIFDAIAKTQINLDRYIPLKEREQMLSNSKPFNRTSHLSGLSTLSDSSIENTVSTNSTTSPEFEKALQKLGLHWALSTLKKTQETMALSSSSSVDYPSPDTDYLTNRIMTLKKLNEESLKELQSLGLPLKDKAVIESSCSESDGQVRRIVQKTEFQISPDNSNDVSQRSSDFKSFLAQELAKKARNISLDKESIFRSLLTGSKDITNISDLNVTHIPSSQTNQRTSTPVFADRKTSTSSKANSMYDTLFSGSTLSSVKNISSDNQNLSTSGNDYLIEPSIARDRKKNHRKQVSTSIGQTRES